MKKLTLLFLTLFLGINIAKSQTNIADYANPQDYVIGGITISGTKYLDKNTLISISGLNLGETISVPGEDISLSIKKLWKQALFSDVSISITKIEDGKIFLDIYLKEHPKLSKFNFKGDIKKHDITELKEQLKLMRGKTLTNNLINNSIYKIELYFKDKGFNNVSVNYSAEEDKQTVNASSLTFTINKGERVKIKEIIIHGRELRKNEKKTFYNKADMTYAISDYTLSKKMKETKPKKWWRFFKVSKFNEDNLQTIDGSIQLYEDGSVKASLERVSHGIQYDQKSRYDSMSEEDLKKHYKTKDWSYNNNLEINSVALENDKDSVVFTEKMKTSITDYATINENDYLFRVNMFNRNTNVPKRYRDRTLPLKISRGYQDIDHYTYTIPKGYTFVGLPEEKNITTKFGSYKVSFTKIDATTFTYKKSLLIKAGDYPKEDYKDYRKFRKAIAKYDNLRISLVTTN